MAESSAQVVRRYLEDVVAAETAFASQYGEIVRQIPSGSARESLKSNLDRMVNLQEQLAKRLHQLGGSVPGARGFFAQLFGLGRKYVSRHEPMRNDPVKNLIHGFAINNNELAMYEALANVSEAAGDVDTADLARLNQQEVRLAAEAIWAFLKVACSESLVPAQRLPQKGK